MIGQDDALIAVRLITETQRNTYFVTGQSGASRRLFVPRERTVLQAIFETTVPSRLYCPQLESAGGPRR